MKKLLLLGLILVCFLAFPQGAAAATSTASANLTANEQSTIEITITGTETPWSLVPGSTFVENNTLQLVVNSTTAWDVAASDADTVNTNGFMTNWTGSAYVTSTKLANALQVKATGGNSGGTYVTLPTSQSITTGDAGTNQVSYPLGFQQPVTYADPALPSPNVYRIVVTLTGTNI